MNLDYPVLLHFQRAVELRPAHAPGLCNLAVALMDQGQLDEAVAQLQEALQAQPDCTDAHFNLGNVLRKQFRYDEAMSCYNRALELEPSHPGALLNVGIVHTELGRLEPAVSVFTDLLARKPYFVEANNCLGIALLHQQKPAEALAQFDQGLTYKPNDAEMHLNRALCLLALGDNERGWPEYEWRWKLKKATPCPVQLPAWDGSALPNGTIVLWSEQGLGDTLQFIRYAPLVKQRVGRVLLACPGPLRSLLAKCPGIDAILEERALPPNADVQAPLLNLPKLFGTTLASIPANVPYLHVGDHLRRLGADKIGSGYFNVGIAWQGNPQFSGDRYRSIPLEQFRPLAKVAGVKLFSLQKGKGAEQLQALRDELSITDLGSQLGDFRDTAAAIENLDLVVAVDTSVAHLTGAMGKSVFVLLPANPDWRWLLGRSDSLWYRTTRLFRQQAWGDWGSVLEQVATALDEMVHSPVPRSASATAKGVEPSGSETTQLILELQFAQAELDDVDRSMRSLAAGPEAAERAVDLVRRYALAQQQRSQAIAALAAHSRPAA